MAIPPEVDGGADRFGAHPADYRDGFAIGAPPVDWSAEEWARCCLEEGPAALRWFVVAGWRIVLGLRLGPRASADHVLGWRIEACTAESITLEVESWLLQARIVLTARGGRVTWSTFVRYQRAAARFVWVPVSLLHHRIVPLDLRLAARAARRHVLTASDHGPLASDG